MTDRSLLSVPVDPEIRDQIDAVMLELVGLENSEHLHLALDAQEVIRTLLDALARLTAENQKLANQMLALLVMDLGYGSEDWPEPRHGHHPIRHQLAWRWATEALGEAVVAKEVPRMRAQEASEQDPNSAPAFRQVIHARDALQEENERLRRERDVYAGKLHRLQSAKGGTS